MRWFVWILSALALVIVMVALVGAMLPKKHVASRTVFIGLTPEALYAILADVDGYPAWRRDVTSLQRQPDRDGRPVWIEQSGRTKIPLHFERMQPPSLLVARIDGASLPFGGTWTYRINRARNGSDLTITEDGEVYNVIFRFVSRFVFGHHATIDRFIGQLQSKAGAQ